MSMSVPLQQQFSGSSMTMRGDQIRLDSIVTDGPTCSAAGSDGISGMLGIEQGMPSLHTMSYTRTAKTVDLNM